MSVTEQTTTPLIYAQAAGGGGIFSDPFIWMMIIFFVAFYFLVIRPQNKKLAKQRELIEALKQGDEVILGSGVVGTIENIAGQYITIRSHSSAFFVQRAAVTQILPKGTVKELGKTQSNKPAPSQPGQPSEKNTA